MLQRFIIFIVIVLILFVIKVVVQMLIDCKREDKLRDELVDEYIKEENNDTENRSDILSDLEMQTVEKLQKLFKPDSLCNVTLFEINKNENMTVGECLDRYYENDGRVILNDGKVLGVSVG